MKFEKKDLVEKFKGFTKIAVIGAVCLGKPAYDHFIKSEAEKERILPYSEFGELAKKNRINEITIEGTEVTGKEKDQSGNLIGTYSTEFPENADIVKFFNKSNAKISVNNFVFEWRYIFYSLLALYILNKLGVKPISSLFEKLKNTVSIEIEKSKTTETEKTKTTKTEYKAIKTDYKFNDVAGIDEIREDVQSILEFFANKELRSQFGIIPLKGVLLSGPPGNGKTLLAKAIAGEAKVSFFSVAATDLEDKWYGGSSKKIRGLFKAAKENAPSIIFVDELDAICKSRSNNKNSDGDISPVVAFLTEMDGFKKNENVLVIAATNMPESLDPALLRPGRFDRQIVIPMPDVNARKQILEVHSKNRPLSQDVDLTVIAQCTYGFSGADLANLVNEAAINASKRLNAKEIEVQDFESAADRIMLGLKRNLTLNQDQKRMTAWHEAGHTILILELESKGIAPLHKVTIAPHGQALGVTMSRQDEEKYTHTLKELKAQLIMAFGGRIAEELMTGDPEDVSTGASNDIQQATNIAWNMVTKFGFSNLGPIKLGNNHDGFLGGSNTNDLDANTSAKVFEEITRIVNEAQGEARKILTEKKPELEKLAKALLEKETLLADEVRSLLGYPIKHALAAQTKLVNAAFVPGG
jgi:cell division protease FtsH